MSKSRIKGLRSLSRDHTGTAGERLGRFVRKAKDSPALKGVVWEANNWSVDADDVSAQRRRAHKSALTKLYFSNRESSSGKRSGRRALKDPMVEPYLSFAKADVRLYAEASGVSLSVLGKRLAAHRMVEAVLRRAGNCVSPTELTLRHFHLVEETIGQEFNGTARYRYAGMLEAVGRVIDANGLSQVRIGYTNRFARPLNGDELSEAGQAIGAAKMMSPEGLNDLAAISASPPDDHARFIIRIVDLMIVGGFRIGEVLTLPLDCWVENHDSRVVNPATGEKVIPCGIVYAAEKVRDYQTKWLPSAAVELARRAIDDLTRLCAPARGLADWMETHPGRLKPLAHLDPEDWIPGSEAREMLGLASKSVSMWKIIRRLSEDGNRTTLVRVRDIESLYLRRGGPVDVLRMPSGRCQSLSDSLVVGLVNQFHGGLPTLKFLPCAMKGGIFQDALSPSEASAKGGKIGILGASTRVTTHQFRHWLNTLADNGGLSDVDLAKWMGRKDISQNAVYKHGTLVQRTNAAKELILSGQTHGRLARIASTVTFAERKEFLDGAVEAAHNTQFGLCLHNFAASPCGEHHACLRGCGDYLRVKGDQDQRRALLELKAKEIASLEGHQQALTDGFYGAEKWVESSSQHLAGINAALAVDDSPESGADLGAATPVFPNAASKRKELK